ncbi:protein adenylyltransferase SelO [Azospira restricta]|uniref:Protein nucleotidyltransferase YdiU n=1 Tax=Azospira restricta TaxID=404405 RepID=A0A974Y3V3_9RHOO|nr:YdiU family protein [Azospira restricta]QRJ64099.1 YdiU family protein [Azospira restricta]
MLTRAFVPLAAARFDHHFARHLPGESGPPRQPRPVHGACWSDAPPTPVAAPALLAWSDELAATLGLAPPDDAAAVADVLAGNRLLPGMRPIAACYGGHQFGQWAGQLGDGRAIVLGDLVAPDGQRWEIQLKGAGLTPYSRRADGRAVLRSSLREFVCSEAMHHLGVPTTRALALVGSGEPVLRDMFYDGRPAAEPGAIVTRAAPSFVRFGNFEIFAARSDHERLRLLADYVIDHYFPEIGGGGPARYAAWFAEVARRTARLMAHWLRVGFVHGVMNTDNLSILGLTIDYGPFGWLDVFDPDFTPNTTDQGGRYAYAQQPAVAQWNLLRLAEALLPLVERPQLLEAGLSGYGDAFEREWGRQARAKIGLADAAGDADDTLVAALFGLLPLTEVDTTLFFGALAEVDPSRLPETGLPPALAPAFYAPEALPAAFIDGLRDWLSAYAARLRSDGVSDAGRRACMAAANPRVIPRNYLLQEAIDAAAGGDLAPLARLLAAIRAPYGERPEHAGFTARRPEWARHAPGCAALSCSS